MTPVMLTRSSLVAVIAFGLLACGGAVVPVDDGKSPAPRGTSPSKGDPPPAPGKDDPGNDLPQRSPAPPPVLASSYDQSCNVNSECAPIAEMKDCNCACPNAAVNVRDVVRAQQDLAAHGQQCKQHQPEQSCGVFCAVPQAFCDTSVGVVGVCRLKDY